MKTKLTILTFLLLNILTYSEIRYVSPQGNNTAPFISWATASHTIQGCIDVSSPGDTIYVGNGVYKEVVIMIRKLALIGSGIDSCIIDTRELAVESGFGSIVANNSCSVESFQIIVSNYNDGIFFGEGVRAVFSESHYTVEIKNNLIYGGFSGTRTSINAVIKNNMMVDNSNGLLADGGLFDLVAVRIENNFILARENSQLGTHRAISMTPVKKSIPYIIGNTIAVYKDELLRSGYLHAVSASNKGMVANNLIYSKYNHRTEEPYGIILQLDIDSCYNNVIIGDYWGIGYYFTHPQKIKNNVIVNARKGLFPDPYTSEPEAQYNNIFNTAIPSDGFTLDSTNISVDPMFVNEDSLDFRLQMFSPLIDAGDPEILDKDGSRSDIGLFGGPYGESYKYQDYAPKPPKNLTAEMNENEVTLNWLYNTEADFSHYRVYRDTVPNFIYDTTKVIAEVKDTTIYKDKIRAGRNVYYKITAMDNQGNQSAASEEVSIISVGVEKPKLIANDYKLFQNYPNPFNPSTMISYRLKENSRVRIVLYSTTGEKVEEIVNKHQAKGYYEINYNARKRGLSSGIYILRMEVKDENNIPGYTDAKKMILVK